MLFVRGCWQNLASCDWTECFCPIASTTSIGLCITAKWSFGIIDQAYTIKLIYDTALGFSRGYLLHWIAQTGSIKISLGNVKWSMCGYILLHQRLKYKIDGCMAVDQATFFWWKDTIKVYLHERYIWTKLQNNETFEWYVVLSMFRDGSCCCISL